MKQDDKTIEQKITDLETQVAWFDSEDFTINQAIEKYETTKKLAEEIVRDIDSIKNKITVVNKQDS